MKKTQEENIKILMDNARKFSLFNGSSKNYLMRNNGFYVGFNMPDALSGDASFGLPPYAKRMPYLVDKYPACPKDWLKSEGIVKSYFVPVVENKGMWLDFNENASHTHHIAIVVSVQGINPITGLPCKDAQLEQYIEECPKHKIKFGPDRYCSKCDYKWPKQNYICTTGTPKGHFWLDGFRTVEGMVRQYILSAEKMKGVASNIIGKERVYAIGLSFFISKEKRPITQVDNCLRSYGSVKWAWNSPSTYNSNLLSFSEITESDLSTGDYISSCSDDEDLNTKSSTKRLSKCGKSRSVFKDCCSKSDLKRVSDQLNTTANDPNLTIVTHHAFSTVQTQKLEIGAGAKINQSVYDDPERLEFWHDNPESIICINYCNEEDALKIIDQGEIDLEGHAEGFLKNVPVGN